MAARGVYLEVHPARGKGLGVFAVHRIKSNKVILTMHQARVIDSSNWDEASERMGLPEDCGIHCPGNKVIYDPSVTLCKLGSGAEVSTWYRMNHCNNPNTRMRMNPTGECIEWVTLRCVSKGEEITFHYGDPDPSFL